MGINGFPDQSVWYGGGHPGANFLQCQILNGNNGCHQVLFLLGGFFHFDCAHKTGVIEFYAGSIFHLPDVYAEPEALTPWLRENNIRLVVTAADAEKTIYEADLSGPLSMVFGNEAHGVSSQLKKTGPLSLRIPIFGNAESLNVATAAAICLYEGIRQRTGHREARGT